MNNDVDQYDIDMAEEEKERLPEFTGDPSLVNRELNTPISSNFATREAERIRSNPNSNEGFFDLVSMGKEITKVDIVPDFYLIDQNFDQNKDANEILARYPEDIQEKFKGEGEAHSMEELNARLKKYSREREVLQTLGEYGMEGGIATVVGAMTDETSLALSMMGGVAGGAATTSKAIRAMKTAGDLRRAAKIKRLEAANSTSRKSAKVYKKQKRLERADMLDARAARIEQAAGRKAGLQTAVGETVGAEAALAGTKLGLNENYTSDQFMLDMMMAPVMGYGAQKILNGGGAVKDYLKRNNDAFINSTAELVSKVEDTAIRRQLGDMGISEGDAGYETAYKNVRWDMFAQTQKAATPTMRDLGMKTHKDGTGSVGNKQGQGITADTEFDGTFSGVLGTYNSRVKPIWKKIMKANGVSMHRPDKYEAVHGIYEQVSDRVRRALYNNDLDSLNPLEKELARHFGELTERSLKHAQDAGYESARRITASRTYVPMIYDKNQIRQMMSIPSEQKALKELWQEAYYQGYRQAGKGLTREESKVLADSTLRRMRDYNEMDDIVKIEDFLQDPKALLKELEVMVREGKFYYKGVTVEKLRDKLMGKNETSRLKQRAYLDRNVSVTRDDGSVLDFFSMSKNNINELAEGYARGMIGKGVLARHLKIKKPEDLTKLREKVKRELKQQGAPDHVAKAELEMFEESIARLGGRAGVEMTGSPESRRNLKTWMNLVYSAMLGGAGLAQVMDITSAAFRNGILNTVRSMPLLRKMTTRGSAEAEYLLEELQARDIAFHSPNMMQAFSQFADDGSAMSGKLHYASKVIAEQVGNLSGLSPMTRIMQETSYIASMHKTIKAFQNGKKAPYLKSETGWTDAQAQRFAKLIKKYKKTVTDKDFGGTIEVPDFDQWPAADAREFMLGHYNISLRQASKSMTGENIRFLETVPGRLLFQFKQIVLTSWSRKALHSFNNVRSEGGMQANALTMTGELVGAYLMIWGKIESKTNGMDRAKKDEYVQRFGFENWRHYEKLYRSANPSEMASALEKLGGEYFMFAASYSPSYGSLFMLGDIAASFTGTPLPGRRYQPVESSLLSNPTLSILERGSKGAFGLLDGEVSEADYRNLKTIAAYNSLLGMHYFHNKIGQSLPED